MTFAPPPPPRPSPQPPELSDVKTDPGFRMSPVMQQLGHAVDKAVRRRQRRTMTWAGVAFAALTLFAPELKEALKAITAAVVAAIRGHP